MKQITTICYVILFVLTPGFQQLQAQTDTTQLLKKPDSLKAVTVTARKPFIEQKIDRTVINVRSSISTVGTTALDVLERSPGIVVNRQSNLISMAGKEGVMIMINGKISYMPLAAVLQMLKGMNAANIERIELITTPPANLDAEGNAGYINIVLVNHPEMGINGSYSLTMGFGRGETPAASANINYRTERINLYGDYSFSRQHQLQYLYNDRRVMNQAVVTETNMATRRNPVQRNHNIRLGLDWTPSAKTIIGMLAGAYDNRWSMDARNEVHILNNGHRDTSIVLNNDEVNHWQHLMTNLNLQHHFNKDRILTINANYLHYRDENPTNYANVYFDGKDEFLFDQLMHSNKTTPITIWVGSLDYSFRPAKQWQVEMGLKGVRSRFKNDVLVQSTVQDNWVTDPNLTANYFLKEQIGAAYTTANFTPDQKTTIKAGLRYEYTESNLGTDTKQKIVDRKYGRFFPSIFISRKLNKNQSLNLSYSKRITRPTFNDMAPFVIFLDPNTFFSGNPALQPAFTDIVKADYSFRKYLVSLAYSHEADAIAGFQVQVNTAENKQFFGAQNLHYRKTVTLTVMAPLEITNWWTMQNNLIVNWQEVHADINKQPITVHQTNFNLSATWRFKLPKNFSAELSGVFYSKALYGTAIAKSMGSLNAGIQKKLKKGSISITGNNMLHTMQFRMTNDVPAQQYFVRSRFIRNVPTFMVTYAHNFGKSTVKQRRSRGTGSEEEGTRIR